MNNVDIIQQVMTMVEKISMLTLLGLVGYIAGKTRYLPENSGIIISRLVIKLTAPMLIFTTLANYDFDKKIIEDGMWIYFFGLFFLLFSFVFGVVISKILKLEGAKSNIYKMHFMFGNVIFLAFPLLESIYGGKGLIYAVFFTLANDTLLWTLGVYLVNKHKKIDFKEGLKHLVNGNTIAFSLGIIIIMLKFNFSTFINSIPNIEKISGFTYKTFHDLGSTTIILSMLFIGLILADIKINGIKDLLSKYPIFIMALFKLVIIPFLIIIIFIPFKDIINPLARAVIVLSLIHI